MTDASPPRDPRAFKIDDPTVQIGSGPEALAPPDDKNLPAAATPRPRPRTGWRWGWLFVAAIGALASLALTIAVTDFVTSLLQRGGYVGWIAVSLAAIAALALLAVVIRELAGIARLSRLGRIRTAADAPILSDKAVRRIIADLARLYAGRPELGVAISELRSHEREIIDPPERLEIAERALMPALDAEARRLISDAAKRVSLVTAISPAAVIDLGVVLFTQLSLIRQIATLYGGRPGLLGLLRLSRLVIAHLAVTGSIALGDDLIQQIVGHSLAARLSTRLGEGVFNGLMTGRVGIAALAVCRPLPFRALGPPRVTDYADFILPSRSSGVADRVNKA